MLRRPDVPAAGAALGISIPAKLRTAADVSGLHRPWAFAIGAGLIRVADGKATAAGLDVDSIGDQEMLDRWLAGLRAVCAAETPPGDDGGVLLLVLALLEVLDGVTVPDLPDLPFWHAVSVAVHNLCDRYNTPYRNAMGSRSQFDGARRATAHRG